MFSFCSVFPHHLPFSYHELFLCCLASLDLTFLMMLLIPHYSSRLAESSWHSILKFSNCFLLKMSSVPIGCFSCQSYSNLYHTQRHIHIHTERHTWRHTDSYRHTYKHIHTQTCAHAHSNSEPDLHYNVDPYSINGRDCWRQVNSLFHLPGLELKPEGSSASEKAHWLAGGQQPLAFSRCRGMVFQDCFFGWAVVRRQNCLVDRIRQMQVGC